MKRTMSLTVAIILCASQVSALSCMRPDVARAFQWASDADESYVAMLGRFAFETPPYVAGTDINNPVTVTVDAVFTGQTLGADRFQQNAPIDVTLVFECLSAWCGSLPDDGTLTLAFVEKTDSDYVLSVGPCFGEVFLDPTPAQISTVEACMRGESCEETPMR